MAREPLSSDLAAAIRQEQFLSVISRDEAMQRFMARLTLQPIGDELLPLAGIDGRQHRILSRDIQAVIDVPAFDRANVDGFAIRSADVSGAMEESPRHLILNPEVLAPGIVPSHVVSPGTATPIATGGMIPRGADAVLMIEHSDVVEVGGRSMLEVQRASAAGESITFAGTDIARGETVLWAGQAITSRELGVMAALGLAHAWVYRRPRVAIISTGNEIVPPGQPLPAGHVYDSNAAILSAAVCELGGDPIACGAIPDSESELAAIVEGALHDQQCDVVLLSGGTSKGAGDLSYRMVSRFNDPGIVAHGVALKPGKPICLAVTAGKPVVVLPGFPTSAIFTFHEFVAPVIRALAGRHERAQPKLNARLPLRVHSEKGRTEYVLTRLFRRGDDLYAYPIGKGSGSVTTFSQADGFITIPQHGEMLEASSSVEVTLLDEELQAPDLVVIGSHCVGLDYLIGQLRRQGITTTTMAVGSQGGIAAAKREECDIAGCHLLDPATNMYNQPFVPDNCVLIPGYARRQCLVYRPDDPRLKSLSSVEDAVAAILNDQDCVMVNRNPGSGTRILIDRLLHGAGQGTAQPVGYAVQVKSHNAVAAAVAQGRADWGIAIDTVAREYGLAMIPWVEERYDFIIPRSRVTRPAVRAFQELLQNEAIRDQLRALGFQWA